MTKAKAEAARLAAVERVKAAQAALGSATGAERDRCKRELDEALAALAHAKAELRKINLAAMGAKPIEPESAPPAPPTIEELATRLLESFQQLLIANCNHPAIRSLRAHFLAELARAVPQSSGKSRLRPPEPPPLRSRQRIPYLDASGRQVAGPGTILYRNGARD